MAVELANSMIRCTVTELSGKTSYIRRWEIIYCLTIGITHCRLLFVYGNQQKRVEFSLEDEESGACVKGIKERACRIFNLQNAHVKLWDRGFEDWCDPDNDQEIVENNTKVLITEEEAICTSAPTVPSTLSSPCGYVLEILSAMYIVFIIAQRHNCSSQNNLGLPIYVPFLMHRIVQMGRGQ